MTRLVLDRPQSWSYTVGLDLDLGLVTDTCVDDIDEYSMITGTKTVLKVNSRSPLPDV